MAYEGSITIADLMDGAPGADGSSVSKATILYYLDTKAVVPVSPQSQSSPWSEDRDVQDQWTKKIPTYVSGATYYVCLESEITNNVGVRTYVYGDAVEDNGLTDAATNSSEAITISRATQQHFWFVSEKTGTIDAGAYITDTPIDTFKQGKSGGYLYASSTGLTLGKDNNALMALSGSELDFYRPGTSTIDAKLNSSGLTLTKGGIKAGTVNSSGFVYLSTDNYGSNVTINNHQASNWKQIIGTKFGVDADGNLYAANADISGKITVGAGSNVYTTDDVNPLEIGGRNLFISYDSLATAKRKINDATSYTYNATTGVYVIKQTAASTGFVQIWTEDGVSDFSSILGKTVTLSARSIVTSNSAAEARVYCYCIKSDGSSYGFGLTKNELTRTFVMPKDVVRIGYIIRLDQNKAGSVNETATFTGIKLELGNKATDWTPAPEDVQAEIDAKKSVHTIDSTYKPNYSTALNWAKTSQTYSNNEIDTTGVKVGDTVRLGVLVNDFTGNPRVYVVGTVTTVDSSSQFTMMGKGLDTTIIDGGNILTNSIGANQIKANAIDTSKLTIGAQDEMLNSKIEVGGRNILRGTANPTPRGNLWKDFGWYTSGSANGTIEWGVRLPSSPIPEITNGLKMTVSKANASFSPGQGGVPLRKGTVTLSAWVKGTAGDIVSIRPVWASSDGSGPEDMTRVEYTIPDSDWHRYEATQVINYDHEAGTTTSGPNNGYANAGYVFVQSSTVGRVFYMAGIKLEYGNKATDWTASPDDYVNDADNMLLDWDVPSLTMVNAKSNRYWSDASNTWITPSFQTLFEPPEEGIKYLQRYVVSTANSSAGNRCLAFYYTNPSTHFTALPLKLNTPYTVSFWARKTSGSGRARVVVNGVSYKYFDLTSDWKRYTFTFTMTTKPSDYYRVWIGSNFPANTTGTVEVCGCKLVAGTDGDEAAKTATNYITTIDNNGITIHPADENSVEYLQIDSTGVSINTIKGVIAKYGTDITLGDLLTYLKITSDALEFFDNKQLMARFGYDEIFESYGIQGENVFIKGAGNALRLDNNVNGTYQGQYILETRANGHLSLKPGLQRTEEV